MHNRHQGTPLCWAGMGSVSTSITRLPTQLCKVHYIFPTSICTLLFKVEISSLQKRIQSFSLTIVLSTSCPIKEHMEENVLLLGGLGVGLHRIQRQTDRSNSGAILFISAKGSIWLPVITPEREKLGVSYCMIMVQQYWRPWVTRNPAKLFLIISTWDKRLAAQLMSKTLDLSNGAL